MAVVCRLSSQFIAIHPHILDQFDIASNQLEMICSDMSAMTFFEAENDRVNTKLKKFIDFYIEWIDLLTSIRSSIR